MKLSASFSQDSLRLKNFWSHLFLGEWVEFVWATLWLLVLFMIIRWKLQPSPQHIDWIQPSNPKLWESQLTSAPLVCYSVSLTSGAVLQVRPDPQTWATDPLNITSSSELQEISKSQEKGKVTHTQKHMKIPDTEMYLQQRNGKTFVAIWQSFGKKCESYRISIEPSRQLWGI